AQVSAPASHRYFVQDSLLVPLKTILGSPKSLAVMVMRGDWRSSVTLPITARYVRVQSNLRVFGLPGGVTAKVTLAGHSLRREVRARRLLSTLEHGFAVPRMVRHDFEGGWLLEEEIQTTKATVLERSTEFLLHAEKFYGATLGSRSRSGEH